MNGLRRALARVPVALALAGTLASAGSCGRPRELQIIRVNDIAPRDVELDERIAIAGEGFPSGKAARLTFRGTLRRVGARAVDGADVTVWGTAVSSNRVEATIDQPTQALFCGAGDHATHTMFDGQVEVAFAASAVGAPPVAGLLEGVTLDMHPAPGSAAMEHEREGLRLMDFLGVQVIPAGAHELRVERVEAGSRAQAAGILQGDRLVAFDGIHLASAADIAVLPGDREASFVLRRGSVGEIVRTVPIDGFQRDPSEELLWSALVIVAALAAALLFTAPLPAGAAAAVQRVARSLRSRTRERPASHLSVARRMAKSAGRRPRSAPLGLSRSNAFDIVPFAALGLLPFGPWLGSADLDVGFLFLGIAASLGMVEWWARGPCRGVPGALHVAARHLPAVAAVASAVITFGSVRAGEIVRAQGGWPWEWLAFHSPAGLLSLPLFLSAATMDLTPPVPGTSFPRQVALIKDNPLRGTAYWKEGAGRCHRTLLAGLAVVLFLGGWSIPGMAPTQQEANLRYAVVGAGLLLTKVVAVLLVLRGAGRMRLWLLPPEPVGWRTFGQVLVVRVLMGCQALAVTLLWARWSPDTRAQAFVSGSLVIVFALASIAAGHRLWHGIRAPEADGRLSPFL
jgi:hypothetical protein